MSALRVKCTKELRTRCFCCFFRSAKLRAQSILTCRRNWRLSDPRPQSESSGHRCTDAHTARTCTYTHKHTHTYAHNTPHHTHTHTHTFLYDGLTHHIVVRLQQRIDQLERQTEDMSRGENPCVCECVCVCVRGYESHFLASVPHLHPSSTPPFPPSPSHVFCVAWAIHTLSTPAPLSVFCVAFATSE